MGQDIRDERAVMPMHTGAVDRPIGAAETTGDAVRMPVDLAAGNGRTQPIRLWEQMDPAHLKACMASASQVLQLAHDPAAVADFVVNLALAQLDSRRGSLMVLDPQSQMLRIRAAKGLPADVVDRSQIKLGEGVAGWVASQGKPVLVEDVPSDTRVDVARARDYQTQTYLSVPVQCRNCVTGVLSITDPAGGRRFGQGDLDMLTRIASMGGLALQQADMFVQAKELAIRDDLTGLYNRRYLRHFLDSILERARTEHFAVSVIIFDLDHFKRYNDTFGHPAGDRVLQDVARAMHASFRTHDAVCRYGGEEFAVVLWDHGPQRKLNSQHPIEALAFADRLRHTIQLQEFPHLKGKGDTQLTISGGLATFPWDGSTRPELISKADQALYRAKRDGRNRIYLSKPIV